MNTKNECFFCDTENDLIGDTIKFCTKCKFDKINVYKEITRYPTCHGEIDQITDKIYLGNFYGALNKDELKLYGIENILVAGFAMPCIYPEDFKYLQIDIMDDESENLTFYLNKCFEFINKCDTVYVHCQAGVSRSASIVIAYLMKNKKISYVEARNIVKKKRDCICPNDEFEKQLIEYEKLCVNI